jgi:DNA polymerase III epsilon subunit-like protein
MFIDVETGGLKPNTHSLLSVGISYWDIEEEVELDSIEVYIKEPQIMYVQEAMSINGISLSYLDKYGLTPIEAHKQLIEFIQQYYPLPNNSAIVGGHNPAFDISFLERLPTLDINSEQTGLYCTVHLLDFFSHRIIDTSGLAKTLWWSDILKKDLSKSNELFDYFGINEEGRHTALFDARATGKSYCEIIKVLKNLSLVES